MENIYFSDLILVLKIGIKLILIFLQHVVIEYIKVDAVFGDYGSVWKEVKVIGVMHKALCKIAGNNCWVHLQF